MTVFTGKLANKNVRYKFGDKCGQYLPTDQLISTYIESFDRRIRTYFREAREDKRHITLFELCRKAAKKGESLQRKPKTILDHPSKLRGVILQDVNAIDGDRMQQDPPASSSQSQTQEHAYTIDSEALAFVQPSQARQILPVLKSTYPYKNPRGIYKPL
eukprot:IDg7151t1